MREMSDDLAAKTVEFCSRLRSDHGFNVGPREALEALQAIEIVGLERRPRVAAALRSVCCSKEEEIDVFDRAFDGFFSSLSQGVAQPRHPRRRRRIQDETLTDSEAARLKREPEGESAAEAWQTLLARYSPTAAVAEAPAIPTEGLEAMRRAVGRLVTRLHLGRSRRWKPQPHGERFDLRRTLRASLRTGGDVIEPHTLGHPLRNPRFVVLLDGSRSMTEYAPRLLQFAYALCKRSRRASAFLFSTQLHDVTLKLRDADRRSYRLKDLGEAWGGGTRIGASLSEFVRQHRAGLTDQTFVIIMSDGLDVGDISQLQRAMHEISRQCAAIAWVNPHAGRPGYAPSARGMQAALPYVTAFVSLDDMEKLTELGRRSRTAACA